MRGGFHYDRQYQLVSGAYEEDPGADSGKFENGGRCHRGDRCEDPDFQQKSYYR